MGGERLSQDNIVIIAVGGDDSIIKIKLADVGVRVRSIWVAGV